MSQDFETVRDEFGFKDFDDPYSEDPIFTSVSAMHKYIGTEYMDSKKSNSSEDGKFRIN